MDSFEKQLAALIDRFAPNRAKEIRAVRRKMRTLLPTATEVVYDYGQSLVISYSPNEKGYLATFSIAAKASGTRLYFGQGAKILPDPTKRLSGNAKVVRSLSLEGARTLDEKDVRALMNAALERAEVRFDPKAKPQLIIKPSSKAKTKTKVKAKSKTKRNR
jgi:Predicted ferric reductase